MEPDPNQPMIKLGGASNKTRIGVGAMVGRSVQVPVFGTIPVVAKAQAYVVEGSGQTAAMAPDPMNPGVQRPVFKPTYWVKLAGFNK